MKKEKVSIKKLFTKKELLVFLLVFLGTFTLFRTLLFLGYVPSESMEPTLDVGAGMFGTKFSPENDLKHGNIVVFDSPEGDGTKWIKRIIGLPGDKIEFKDNKIYRNGKALKEPYIKSDFEYDDAEYNVPDNCVFLMGDNRDNSVDSRFWSDPYMPVSHLRFTPKITYPLRPSCHSGVKKLN